MIMKKKYTGFTLIELMVTVAVMGIVLAVGLPKASTFFKGNRMITNTNDFISGLHIARSTAIKEGGRVTMCKSTNAGSGSPTCATGAEGWEEGWFVFVEGTNVGNLIGTFNTNDGPILRINEGAAGKDTTIETATLGLQNFVSFSSRGLPTQPNGNSVSGIFMVCDDRGLKSSTGNVVANGIVLLASGRAGASKTESKIGVCP